MAIRPGVFVTGTDTGIGKTVVSACLVQRWSADYWKPAQTGLDDDPGDSAAVAALAGATATRIQPSRHNFGASLSPEAAAEREGKQIALADFTMPAGAGPIVVEGAGGILVPIGGGATMADLMVNLALPAVLVARGSLGTVNHSLLSLEALRRRSIAVWGVVIVGADPDGNAMAIARHGQVDILATLPILPDLDAATIARLAQRLPGHPPSAAAGHDRR